MLRATIELCPYGDAAHASALVEVLYWNVGSYGEDREWADYEYKMTFYEAGGANGVVARPAGRITETRMGQVHGFPRKTLGSAHLLARVLDAAGIGPGYDYAP